MARVFICSGKRSETPLVFQGSSKKLYSTEEICYYLYHNPAMAEDDLRDSRLAAFYETELALPETAKKLRILKEAEASTKEYAETVFSSTLFLTQDELTEYFIELQRISEMKPWQRQKGKADLYLQNHEYRMALDVYEKLLTMQRQPEMSESFRGNVIHNLAVCELHILGPKSASLHFAEAYEQNHSDESLRSYLICLRLAKRDDEYNEAVKQYSVTEEFRSDIDLQMVECAMEAGETKEYQSLLRIRRLLQEGQPTEYQTATRQLARELMEQYRQDAG